MESGDALDGYSWQLLLSEHLEFGASLDERGGLDVQSL